MIIVNSESSVLINWQYVQAAMVELDMTISVILSNVAKCKIAAYEDMDTCQKAFLDPISGIVTRDELYFMQPDEEEEDDE